MVELQIGVRAAVQVEDFKVKDILFMGQICQVNRVIAFIRDNREFGQDFVLIIFVNQYFCA